MPEKLMAALDDLTVVVEAAHPEFREVFLADYQKLPGRNATESLVARLRTIEPSLSHKESDDFYRDAIMVRGWMWRFVAAQTLALCCFGIIVWFSLPAIMAGIPLTLAIAAGVFHLLLPLSLVRKLRQELAASHLRQAYNILKK